MPLGVAFVAALLGIFFYPESKTAFTTILIAMAGAIIVVAVLPNVEEFGVGPKGVNAKLRRVEERLDIQSEVLTEQQRIINQLVIYSLAGQPYEMLRHIEDGTEYIYHDDSPNNDHKRWANFLLDNGFIEPRRDKTKWLQFDQNFHLKNISEFAKTTPAGHFLVTLRDKRV